ncbi:MAG: hypothetical protein J6I40_07130, partial [Mailhella sp.]|nr:hypothetical protein [Mailhella sp.]
MSTCGVGYKTPHPASKSITLLGPSRQFFIVISALVYDLGLLADTETYRHECLVFARLVWEDGITLSNIMCTGMNDLCRHSRAFSKMLETVLPEA